MVLYYSDKKGEKVISHQYSESWKSTQFFCPACGERAVWKREDGLGDYYLEQQHLCLSCGTSFYLPGGADRGSKLDEQNRQRLEHLLAERKRLRGAA